MLPVANSTRAELKRDRVPVSVVGAALVMSRIAVAEALPVRLIVPAFDKPAAVTVEDAWRLLLPILNTPPLLLSSVPPMNRRGPRRSIPSRRRRRGYQTRRYRRPH